MSVAFQFIDVVVVAIIIASTVYAAYRGLVSETLSIFAWIAAAFATLYFGPWLAHLTREMISPSWLGLVVGYAAVFLTVLIPLSFVSYRFSEGVKKSLVDLIAGETASQKKFLVRDVNKEDLAKRIAAALIE